MPNDVTSWPRRHIAELRFSARVIIATVIAFVLGNLLHLAQPYWAVLAALLVIQAYAGASLESSIDWLVGTIGGAIYGAFVASIIPHSGMAGTLLALVVALAPLTVIATINPRFRIAPLTAAIAILIPRQGVGPVEFTLDRTAEIGVGALVAVAVSLLVLPGRAHSLVTESVARLLRLISGLLPDLTTGAARQCDQSAIDGKLEEIRAALVKTDAAVEEARRERETHLASDPAAAPLARTTVRIRNDLLFLCEAIAKPLPPAISRGLAAPLERIGQSGAKFLDETATSSMERRAAPPLDDLTGAFSAYRDELAALKTAGAVQALGAVDAERLFSLSFALHQLEADFKDLANRCTEFATHRSWPLLSRILRWAGGRRQADSS